MTQIALNSPTDLVKLPGRKNYDSLIGWIRWWSVFRSNRRFFSI